MSTFLPSDKEVQELKALNILYGSMLFGVSLFVIVSIVFIEMNGAVFQTRESDRLIVFSTAILNALCLFVSGFFYRKKIFAIKTSENRWSGRLSEYRTMLIIMMAILELGATSCTIAFLLTGNKVLLALVLMSLLVAFTKAPWINRNKEEAGLNIY